jgi:5'-nucleotidase
MLQHRYLRGKPLKILISNDDGVNAKGIKVLALRLAQDAENEVYVVAPDRERSATGHSLTLHKPLRIEEVEYPASVKAAWSTTGTPSDCVKLAVTELMDSPPDIVISGINNGPNLGSEVLYSGTVAAAMEGAFMDIPSIAVSHMYGEKRHYETAAEFISKLVKAFPRAHLGKRSLLNVNVPCLPIDEIKGVLVTELGVRLYDDYFEKRVDPRGRVYYWLAGQAIDEEEAVDTDAWAVLHHNISITPIAFNMTDRPTMKKLQGLKELQTLFHGAENNGKDSKKK